MNLANDDRALLHNYNQQREWVNPAFRRFVDERTVTYQWKPVSLRRVHFRDHIRRVGSTILDAEDGECRSKHVRMPTAPKKGKERARNTTMPGSRANSHMYHRRTGVDPGLNAERMRLQEQREAKKKRNIERTARRLQPYETRNRSISKSLFGEGSNDSSSDPDAERVVDSDSDNEGQNDIGWENTNN